MRRTRISKTNADLSFGRFFMCEEKKSAASERRARKNGKWKKLLFSGWLLSANRSHRIAYTAMLTAVCVVANAFLEFKLADTQFSLTIFVSALVGISLGSLRGFAACFLGDLVGFFYNSAGFAYLPWVGISLGLTAAFAGLFSAWIVGENKRKRGLGLALVCLLSFCVCTVAINTTAFWLLYSKVGYWRYFYARMFLQGQIFNCAVNYALLFAVAPLWRRILAKI